MAGYVAKENRSGAPRGLSEEEVRKAVEEAGGDSQAAWNLVVHAYMDGEVSLSRAAELLGMPYFELEARLQKLGGRKLMV